MDMDLPGDGDRRGPRGVIDRPVLTVDSPTDARRATLPPAELGSEYEEADDRPVLRVYSEDPPRRAAWRRRLIDAERGFAHSVRSESTLTAYLCAAGACLLAAGVLRVTAIEGAVLTLAFVVAVAVELGRIAVREMTDDPADKPHSVMATGSVLAAFAGLAVAAMVLGGKLIAALAG